MPDPAGSIRLKLNGLHPTDPSKNAYIVTATDKHGNKFLLGATRLPQQMVQDLKQLISGKPKG